MSKKRRPLPVLHDNCRLVDTHCHLDMAHYADDLDMILKSAHSCGVGHIITIGIDYKSSKSAIELASRSSMISATVGIHPHDVGSLSPTYLDELSSLIEKHSDQIVGYGEIGLDYVKNYAPQNLQLRAFQEQLTLSQEHGLPVVIHDREAHEDIYRILRDYGPINAGGVMHCFSGDYRLAKAILDLGFFISIPGIVTFKKAHELQEVAKRIPLDRILLETDGPFLAPDPYRGKRNEPKYLLYTAEAIAELRGISIDEVASATTSNAEQLFNITLSENQP